MQDVARSGMSEVARALETRGMSCRIETADEDHLALVVPQEGRRDFVYGVELQCRPDAVFNPVAAAYRGQGDGDHCLPVTYFADGRAGYDIRYMTRDEVIADVLRQFERYLELSRQAGTELLTSAPEHGPGQS